MIAPVMRAQSAFVVPAGSSANTAVTFEAGWEAPNSGPGFDNYLAQPNGGIGATIAEFTIRDSGNNIVAECTVVPGIGESSSAPVFSGTYIGTNAYNWVQDSTFYSGNPASPTTEFATVTIDWGVPLPPGNYTWEVSTPINPAAGSYGGIRMPLIFSTVIVIPPSTLYLVSAQPNP